MYRIIKVHSGERWLLDSLDELGSWDYLDEDGYFKELVFLNQIGDDWQLCAVISPEPDKRTYYFKKV